MANPVCVRTCMACRRKADKSEMLRIVKQKDGKILIDNFGKVEGRGVYICKSEQCANKGLKSKFLNRAFKTEIDNKIYEEVLNACKSK